MVDFPSGVSATDPVTLLGANATDPAGAVISATGRALIAGTDAAAMRSTLGLGTAATAATGDFDAAGAATAAAGAAIITASNDATGKANAAEADAIAAAALDATSKAGTAQSNAIAAAALDATSKAGTAQSNAIAAAALDATSKANAAQAAAILASAQRASNLSDLADAAAARSNLNIAGSMSSGCLTRPIITIGATGLLNVGLMSANLNSASDFTGQIKSFAIAALSPAFQMVANVYYYVTVKYNGGTPIYEIITDNTIVNHSDRIQIANAIWEDGAINQGHVFFVGEYGLGLANKLSHRLIHTDRFDWQDGLQPSETVGRIINIGPGTIWYDGNEINLPAVDSTANPYHLYYHSAPGVWTVNVRSAYSNLEYDDGTGGLKTLGGGDFAVNWVYRAAGASDPTIYVVLGTSSFTTELKATASQPPSSLPPIISKQALLIGRIIVKKSASVATLIDSAFAITFAPSGTISHGDTTNRDAIASHPHSAISMASRTISVSSVITIADYYVRFNGGPGQTLTIPAANIVGAGFTPQFFFRNISTAAVSITDGVTTVSLLPGQKALFMSDGVSTWDVN